MIRQQWNEMWSWTAKMSMCRKSDYFTTHAWFTENLCILIPTTWKERQHDRVVISLCWFLHNHQVTILADDISWQWRECCGGRACAHVLLCKVVRFCSRFEWWLCFNDIACNLLRLLGQSFRSEIPSASHQNSWMATSAHLKVKTPFCLTCTENVPRFHMWKNLKMTLYKVKQIQISPQCVLHNFINSVPKKIK